MHYPSSHLIFYIQPIASGVSFLQSDISIDDPVLWISLATFHVEETYEIENRD